MHRMAFGVAALLASVLAMPGPATAHPHIWIDAAATFVFADKKVVGVRVAWAFDELFSDFLRRQFDPKKTGKFDAEVLPKMKADLAGLKEFNYFTHIRVSNKVHKIAEVAEFQPAIRDKHVIYSFLVTLPAPADPLTTPVSVALYDDSFYVDVALEKGDPVRMEGARGACHFSIIDDRENPIYYGLVFPKRVDLKCRKN
jgi:ABC-type uncharacterized transport system substrate-binding protein